MADIAASYISIWWKHVRLQTQVIHIAHANMTDMAIMNVIITCRYGGPSFLQEMMKP